MVTYYLKLSQCEQTGSTILTWNVFMINLQTEKFSRSWPVWLVWLILWIFFLTLCIRPHRRAPPCAASRWGPGQGRPASHLPPHSPFRHSLLHWFYARHLRGIYIRHQPVSSRCTSCSSSKAVVEDVVGGLWRWMRLHGFASMWGLCSQGALMGWWVGGWSGRVRRAHSRPYPLSCLMVTVLNGMWTPITASCRSEPSDPERCWLQKVTSEVGVRCAFTGRTWTICLLTPGIQSLSRTKRVRLTYWFPNAVE